VRGRNRPRRKIKWRRQGAAVEGELALLGRGKKELLEKTPNDRGWGGKSPGFPREAADDKLAER